MTLSTHVTGEQARSIAAFLHHQSELLTQRSAVKARMQAEFREAVKATKATRQPEMTSPKTKLEDPRSFAMAQSAAAQMAGGIPLAQIARSMGKMPDTLAYHVKKHGFAIVRHPTTKNVPDSDLAVARARIRTKKATRKEEAARLGLSPVTLKEKLRRFDARMAVAA